MKRLECVLKFIKGNTLADIGCDHGYLAIDAIKANRVNKAYCMDINELPLKNAIENIKKNNLSEKITTILSDGLDNLPCDCDIISICGMGGILISSILEKNIDKLNDKLLILEPNNNQNILRKFLNDNSFLIIDEDMCQENGHIYEIIVAKRGKMNLSIKEIDFGPINLRKKNVLFMNKYKNIIKNLEENLKNTTNEESKEKLLNKINYIKESIGE